MMFTHKFFMILTMAILLFTSNFAITIAQDEAFPLLFICVAPDDESDPYLIEFWDSTIFGFLIPEDATVMLFTNTFYVASLFTINTDANTGGYLVMEDLATVRTLTRIPVENPCLNAETEDIFAQLPFNTIPLPISPNHAIVVQENEGSLLTNTFQRIISFTFEINDNEDGEYRNLQVIQNSDLDPFLNFRYFDLTPNTPFMVVANKDFGIGQSLPDTAPPEFSRERPSDIRSFVKSDLADLYSLDIFDLAKQSNANIYIHGGILDTYRGTYIRISLAPDPALRIPAFTPDAMIRALPDAVATFIASEQVEGNDLLLDLPYDSNPQGQLVGDSIYRVIEVDEFTGQLIIDYDGNPAIVESWLVEVVSSQEE